MALPDGTLITVYQPNSVGYYDLTTVDVADLASTPSGSYIYAYASNGVGGFDYQQVLVSDIGNLPAGSEAWVQEPNGVGWYDAVLIATTELVSDYVGPLDIVPGALMAYSQRAMIAGSTSNAIRIAKGSGGSEHTFALTDNAVDVAAVTAFLDGSTPFVARWLNQGSLGAIGDVVQATSDNQPGWAVGLVDFVGNGFLMSAADVTFPAGAGSYLLVISDLGIVNAIPFAVASSDGLFDPDIYMIISGNGTDSVWADYTGTTLLEATIDPAISSTDTFIVFASISATAAYLSVNGVSMDVTQSVLANIGERVARMMLGSDAPDKSDVPFVGKMRELVIWSGDKSASAAALVANAMAHYIP